MGLDFTTTDNYEINAHWSYSGFNEFRRRLAETAGIDLDQMQGFVENGLPWADVDSPLVPLLFHSDCDGDLAAADCGDVFPALLAAVRDWPEDDYDRQHAVQLAWAMKHCSESGAYLQFC